MKKENKTIKPSCRMLSTLAILNYSYSRRYRKQSSCKAAIRKREKNSKRTNTKSGMWNKKDRENIAEWQLPNLLCIGATVQNASSRLSSLSHSTTHRCNVCTERQNETNISYGIGRSQNLNVTTRGAFYSNLLRMWLHVHQTTLETYQEYVQCMISFVQKNGKYIGTTPSWPVWAPCCSSEPENTLDGMQLFSTHCASLPNEHQ